MGHIKYGIELNVGDTITGIHTELGVATFDNPCEVVAVGNNEYDNGHGYRMLQVKHSCAVVSFRCNFYDTYFIK
jgi:hypothetical protein